MDKKINISDYQFIIPQPHPGTPLYEWAIKNNYLNKQGRISYPGLSADDLNYWRFYIYKKIYFSPKYLFSHIIKSFKEPRELIRLFRVAWKGLPQIISSSRIKKFADQRDKNDITENDIKNE